MHTFLCHRKWRIFCGPDFGTNLWFGGLFVVFRSSIKSEVSKQQTGSFLNFHSHTIEMADSKFFVPFFGLFFGCVL